MISRYLLFAFFIANSVWAETGTSISLSFKFYFPKKLDAKELLIIQGVVNAKPMEFMINIFEDGVDSKSALKLVFAFDKNEVALSSTAVSLFYSANF